MTNFVNFLQSTPEIQFDQKDALILEASTKARDLIEGPRVGDFVLFESGELERFSYDWDDSLQTSPGGSFYLGKNGWCSFSGGLNPSIDKSTLTQLDAVLDGSFWFFHHGFSGANRGVNCEAPCRVFKTSAPYSGFLGKDF